MSRDYRKMTTDEFAERILVDHGKQKRVFEQSEVDTLDRIIREILDSRNRKFRVSWHFTKIENSYRIDYYFRTDFHRPVGELYIWKWGDDDYYVVKTEKGASFMCDQMRGVRQMLQDEGSI
jgi:hypothetical protein